ncbi:MAG: response regulator transcription factor [Thiocapsa sp.]|uniref:response regulator transcription factor n=1 Tax=Thiocapsa sp. TaxID=2024551 RepID=UPI001BCE602F|nr:response regulator transcription factor [Thiocapsa sp.]QVL49737.1 MAG: response regulator transcription factor [Thiocapsa sp.]
MIDVRILVVEDDTDIADVFQRGLQAEGYRVDTVAGGRDAITRTREQDYRLIILDLILPDLDGMEVCRILRHEQSQALILMLTARDGMDDKIQGLRLGADDYLTKPFSFEELFARLRALLRRGHYRDIEKVLRVGDLILDQATRRVFRSDREIPLTTREFMLLGYLMANAGKILSRAQILYYVWKQDFDPQTNVVDVYIRYLRNKLGDKPGSLIRTIRGIGYTIDDR